MLEEEEKNQLSHMRVSYALNAILCNMWRRPEKNNSRFSYKYELDWINPFKIIGQFPVYNLLQQLWNDNSQLYIHIETIQCRFKEALCN